MNRLMGWMPELGHCTVCGLHLADPDLHNQTVYWSPTADGVTCHDDRRPNSHPLTAASVAESHRIARTPLADLQREPWPPTRNADLRAFAIATLERHLDRRLRSASRSINKSRIPHAWAHSNAVGSTMGRQYAKTMFSAASKHLQEQHNSRAQYERLAERGPSDEDLDDFVREFITARDSFYLASVTVDGWPYIQHRGGPAGFLRVLDGRTLAFADFAGNKQFITSGNLASNDRVSLFLMDYPHQARLKIIGHARLVEPGEDPALEAQLLVPGYPAKIERIFVISVVAYDWNCSQHITPRFSEKEIAQYFRPE